MAGFDDPAFYGDRWAAVYDAHHAHVNPGPAVEFLAGLRAGGCWSWPSGPGGSRCRWPPGGSPWRGLTPRPRWWNGCGPSPEVTRSRSPSATWPRCRSAAGSGWCTWCAARCSACSARRGRRSVSPVWRALEPAGMFVIECFVPDLTRFDHDQRVQARSVTEDSAIIEVSVHDKVQQRVTTQMITLDGQGMHLRPVAIRYSWPAELDLMADRAGLRLTERHAG